MDTFAPGVTGLSNDRLFGNPPAPGSLSAAHDSYSSTVSPMSLDQSDAAPTFLRSPDPFVLDNDPFGDKTVKWGRRTGQAYTSDDVAGLSVFGKSFTRDELSRYDAGRRLLDITTNVRRGHKRGFLDAVTDFEWSDLPFLSLFASVGKSVSDAVTVSDTFKRMQRGEAVSDEDLIKARLYMAEHEWRETGGVGAMVGDIVRAAPGFMAEFALTGGAMGLARIGAAKLASGSAKWTAALAIDRSTKILAGELAQDVLRTRLAKETAKATTQQMWKKAFRDGSAALIRDGAARKEMVSEIVGGLSDFVKKSGVSAGIADDVATELAEKALTRRLAYEGSSTAFMKFARGTRDHLREWTARGLLDHGTFSSEASTVMFTKQTAAGQALMDAIGAFTVEAHLRGGLMFLPSLGVREAFGDNVVGRNELSLRESAYRQHDAALMEDAKAIGLGMDFMEYVSENAGRGFAPLLRSVGLKLGISGAARQVLRNEGGTLVQDASAQETGGYLRRLIRKSLGTTDDMKAGVTREEHIAFAKAVNSRLANGAAKITEADAARAMASGSADALSDAARAVVGNDVKAFADRAMEDAVGETAFKTMARLRLVRWMAEHDIGPDAVMNAFDRMGYDGVLGEMFEERYSDFEKGLLGLDDKKYDSYFDRAVDTVKGLYPGFDQLLAEALGFAVPGIVRSGILVAQRAIAGGNVAVDRDRRTAASLSSALNGMKHVRMSRGDFEAGVNANVVALTEARDKAETRRAEAAAALNEASTDEERNRVRGFEEEVASLDRRIARQQSHLKAVLEANTPADAAKANADDLIWVQAVSADEEKGDFAGDKAFTVKTDAQVSGDVGSLERGREGLVDLTMDIVEAKQDIEDGARTDMTGGIRRVGLWRWLGSKALGIAGTAATGEIGLAFRNSSSWIGVDEGLPRQFVGGVTALGEELYASERKAMLRERVEAGGSQDDHRVSADELRARVRPKLDAAVKTYLDEWMAVTGTRFVTGSRGDAQAESIVAREMKIRRGEDGKWTDETGAEVPADEVWKRVKDVKREIAKQTYMRLTKANVIDASNADPDTLSRMNALDAIVFSDPMAPGTELAIHKAAMDNLGYRSVHVVASLSDDYTAAESLQSSGFSVSEDDLRDLVGDVTAGRTETGAFDKKVLDLARQMGFPEIDGTDDQIKSLKIRVVSAARQLAAALDARNNSRVFYKSKGTNEDNERFYDVRGNRVTLTATRITTGGWRITFSDGSAVDPKVMTKTFATEAEMMAELSKAGFLEARRPVMLTNVGALRSSDGMAFARKLGLAEAIVRATTGSDKGVGQSTVHPYYRRGPGGWLNDREKADAVFREELDKSWFFTTAGGDKPDLAAYDARLPEDLRGNADARYNRYLEYKRIHDAMFGENGYVTVMNRVLVANGVENCPTERQYYAAYETGSDVTYSMRVDQFSAKTDDSPVVVSVDYGRLQDYSSAFLSATVSSTLDSWTRFIDRDTGIRGALTDMVKAAYREVSAELVAGAHSKEMRRKLEALKSFLEGRDRTVTKQSLSEVIRYVAFHQAEAARDRSPDVAETGVHDAAWLAVAERLRNSEAYIPFVTAVDLMFGGDGFGILLARKATGEKNLPPPNAGVARILDVFGVSDGKTFNDSLSAIRPGGMDTATFMSRVSARAQTLGRERVPVSADDKAKAKATSVRRDGKNSGVAQAIAEVMATARPQTLKDVAKAVAEILGKPWFDDPQKRSRQAFMESVTSVIGRTEAESLRVEKELREAEAKLREAEEKAKAANRRVAGFIQDRKKEEEARERNAALKRQVEELKAHLAELQAGSKAGKTLVSQEAPKTEAREDKGAPGEKPVTRKTRNSNFTRNVKARVEFQDIGDTVDLKTFGMVIPDGNGDLVVSEGFTAFSDLGADTPEGRETRKVGCAIVAAKFRHSTPGETVRQLSKDEFFTSARSLFGYNIRDVELNQMYSEYADAWARGRGDSYTTVDDRPANDQNDDEVEDKEANTQGDAYGTDKAKEMFDNDALQRFLTFASFANPVTYREFQGFMASARTVVGNRLDALRAAEAPKEGEQAKPKSKVLRAFEVVDRLLNPRGQTGDLGRSSTDRQAGHVAILRELDTGAAGLTFNELLSVMSEEDEFGFARSRQIAFLLSYLKALSPEAREELMTLVSSTADCSLGTMEEVQIRDAEGKKVVARELRMKFEKNRVRAVSERAITSSFLFLAHGKRDLAKIAESIRMDLAAAKLKTYDSKATMAGADRVKDVVREYASAWQSVADNSKVLSDILAKYFGRESALCEVLDNPRILSMLVGDVFSAYGRRNRKLSKAEKEGGVANGLRDLDLVARALSPRNAGNGNDRSGYAASEVPLASAVCDILDALAKEDISGQARPEETVARIVTAAFTYGIGQSEGGLARHKQLSVGTPWLRMFEFHAATMPETLTSAELLPERSSKTSATMAAACAGVPPVIESWLDRSASDEGSFAWYAFTRLQEGNRNTSLFEGVTDAKSFDEKVMPWVRQNMCWPDAFRTPILFKNRARDYNKVEANAACKALFDNDFSNGAVTSWVTPVYNGDHSGGVYLRVPNLVMGKKGSTWTPAATKTGEKNGVPTFDDAYTKSANAILADLGLKKLANDSKRSATSSSEAPGRSCYGVRHVGWKTVRGKAFIHLVHNYALDADPKTGQGGHNDCLKGNIPCVGYGPRSQANCAKDPESQVQKLHFMSPSGTDLEFFKGLSVWQDEKSVKRGQFQRGTFQAWAYRELEKYAKAKDAPDCPADLSSHYMLDEDALKVSVLNSKAMGVAVQEARKVTVTKDGEEVEVTDPAKVTKTLMTYIFEKIRAYDPEFKKSSYGIAELAKVLDDGTGDGRFQWYTVDGEGAHDAGRVTLDELLGHVAYDDNGQVIVDENGRPRLDGTDVEVVMLKTDNGQFVADLVYTDPGLASYRVANVSHTSKPEVGRAARNNVVDALTMAAVQVRAKLGAAGSHAKVKRLMDFVSDYGVLVTAMTSDSVFVDAVSNGSSKSLAELREARMPVGGMHWNDQLAYAVFAEMKKRIGIPLFKVDSALNTSGALYDKNLNGGKGGWVDWSQDDFFRALNRGSRVFSDARRDGKFEGIERRLASCRVNVDDPSFRYMWQLADGWEEPARKALGKDRDGETDVFDRVVAGSEYPEMDVIEAVMTAVRRADSAYSAAIDDPGVSDADYAAAEKEWLRLRRAALMMFADHHGRKLRVTDELVQNVCFDDLFIPGSGEDRVFDRSAVFDGRDDEDYIPEFGGKDKDGKRKVWLMGSAFGLPRTPSYNGSMWLQVVRASVPAEEIVVDEQTGEWAVGRDAMVMPDPQTLEILGCDHDGDKCQVYLLSGDGMTGSARYVDLSDDAQKKDERFASDPDARREYLDRMREKGLVEPDDADGYVIPEDIRRACSNTYVQALFDMNRNLRVNRTVDGKPMYDGTEDYDFFRTPMARATKFQPVEEAEWKELKAEADEAKNYLKGSVIADIDTACAVSTSAESADKSRGRVVSLALLLHLAQFSGKFAEGSPNGSVFRWKKEDVDKWIDFIYGWDGLSNATFDDIKEQICLQLGWEPDLVESIAADLIVSNVRVGDDGRILAPWEEGGHPPTTSREFLAVFKRHIKDIKERKARFWASVTANPATDGGLKARHQAVNKFFDPESKSTDMAIRSKDSVMSTLGIKAKMTDGKLVFGYGDLASLGVEATRKFMEAFRDDVIARPPLTADGDDIHDTALRTLVDMTASRSGRNTVSGMLVGTIDMISRGADPRTAVAEFRQWFEGMRTIKLVRDYTNSIMFLKADPGSASYLAERDRLVGVFRQAMRPELADADLDPVLEKMMCARRTAGEIRVTGQDGRPRNLHTIHSAMALAEANRPQAVVDFANAVIRRPRIGRAAQSLAVKLMAAPAQRGAMRLESNAETVQFFLAAMQTIPEARSGTDVMSGNGGLAAWDTLEAIAAGAMGDERGKPEFDGDTVRYTGEFDAIDACNGFAAMFNVLAALWTTGKRSASNPVYGYFNTRSTYDTLDSRDYTYDLNPEGRPVRTIGAQFRQKDAVSYERARAWVAEVMDGSIDPGSKGGSRLRSFTEFGKESGGYADDFALSKGNLDKFLNENLDPQLAEDVITVKRILRLVSGKTGVKDVTITPSSFFSQFLPVYATMTQRVLGAPSPKSKSVLGLIPGALERISERQAAYERGALEPDGVQKPAGRGIMDAVLATNHQMTQFEMTRRRNEDTGVPLNDVDLSGTEGTTKLNKGLAVLGRLGERKTAPADLLEDPEVEAWRRDSGGDAPVRSNPDGVHLVDVFGNGGLLRDLHEYANSVMSTADTEAPEEPAAPGEQPAEPAPEPGKDEKISKLADHLKAILPAATVSYHGGNSIEVAGVFEGSLSRRFGGGKKTNFCIEVRVGEDPMVSLAPGFANVDNPAFCASLCEATRGLLKDTSGDPNRPLVSSDRFARSLTHEERAAIVTALSGMRRDASVKGYSVPLPSWSIDMNGIATLCGYVNVADAGDFRTTYHEYFHQMIAMMRCMGAFGEEDVAHLRKLFGEGDRATGEDFDEERAADEFMEFVDRKTGRRTDRKTGKEVFGNRSLSTLVNTATGEEVDKVWIFDRILEFIKAVKEAIVSAFSYGDRDAKLYLFDMVLEGRVAASNERRTELSSAKTEEEYERDLGLIADQTRTRLAMANYLKGEYPEAFGRLGDPEETLEGATRAMTRKLRSETEEYEDPTAGYVIENPYEKQLSGMLLEECDRMGQIDPETGEPLRPRIAVMEDIIRKLTNLRGYVGEETEGETTARLRVGGVHVDGVREAADAEREAEEAVTKALRSGLTNGQRTVLSRYVESVDLNTGYADEASARAAASVLKDLGVNVPEDYFGDVFGANTVRAAISAGTSRHMDAVYGPVQNVLAAAVNANRMGAEEPGWDEIVRNVMSGQTYTERLAATRRLTDAVKRRIRRFEQTAKLGVRTFKNATGRNGDDNLMYRALLAAYADLHTMAQRSVTSATRAFAVKGTYGEQTEFARGKYRVTANDFAGALAAYSGAGPLDILSGARSRIAAAKAARDRARTDGAEKDRVTRTCENLEAALDSLAEFGDVTQVLSHPKSFGDAADKALRDVFSGIRRGEWDEGRGVYGDYVNAEDEVSDAAKGNRELYALDTDDADTREIQGLLRTFAEAAFTLFGAVKFWRECGTQPGTFHDSAYSGVEVPPTVSVEELCTEFGIGAEQVAGGLPVIDMTCRPEFVASTFDGWLASTMADRIGKLDFREAAMKNSAKYRAALAKLTRAENLLAHVYGTSRAENRSLYRLHVGKRGLEFSDGFYHRVSDDEAGDTFGFNVYGNVVKSDTVPESLTEDGWRDTDLLLKARLYSAAGERKYVTGVSGHTGLRFYAGRLSARNLTREMLPSEDPAYYSFENVQKLHDQMAEGSAEPGSLPPVMYALWNLMQQWHGSVTGKVKFTDRNGVERTYGLDMYDRLVAGIVKGVKKANSIALREDTRLPWTNGSDDPGSPGVRDRMEAAGHEMTSEEYNDIVLESLERDGLVICDYKDTLFGGGNGARSYTGGVRNRSVAAIVFDVAEIEEMYRGSEAYDTLCRAGRDIMVDMDDPKNPGKTKKVHLLSREYYEWKLMKPYREALAEVRKSPWLTDGDGGFFNNLGSPIAFLEGGGGYMYRANRAMRKTREEKLLNISGIERSFEKTVIESMRRGARPLESESVEKLNMLADYYGLEEHGDELRAAIASGKYEPGSKASVRTGLELPKASDGLVLARAIYLKVLEQKVDALDGRPTRIPEESLDRMIAAYEEASADSGEAGVTSGMTRRMMFRMHGALPKNFQLGHHLHETLKGVSDALAFRSTLLNMMFLRGPNGKPMCMARPTADAVAKGGLPDEVWRAAAANLESAYGLSHDPSLTGVERMRKAYDTLEGVFKEAGWKTPSGIRIHSLAPDDMDCRSVDGFMAVADDPFDDNESDVNRTAGTRSTAIGYAKQLFQSSRVLGSSARTQWIQRILSWSKSASVAYSFFFPIATRWESPTGAVGFLATLGSNLSPDFVRKHSKGLNAIQKAFTLGAKEGWLDENFIGVKDVIRMMDTDDPFLADLVTWAESLNITMTDRLSNPLEPTKGIVEADIRRMAAMLRKLAEDRAGKAAGQKMEKRFTQMAEAMFMRSGDRAFTYALNATKLAVTCQMAMKLRKEALAQGKAFDPIRDLAKYATYIDSEIGGVNPLRYAWAHPMMRKALNFAFFSWEWTRTAWEAGGGGIIEDMLFGGHTFTKQERKYILGRWLRMFGSIMVGVPMTVQLVSYLLARAMGRKDDDDKAWTWENEDKTRWTAADITPLLKALGDERTALGRAMLAAKSVPVLGSLVPAYTGTDEANSGGSSNRRYYVHMGKQGWEFFRWFTEPVGQVFSKLSMPTQRILEGVLGRSPSYLQRELPFSNQSSAQRLADVLNPDGAWANFAKAFVPFTVNGVGSFSDAGFVSMIGPVQMGASQTAILTRTKNALRAWAMNDRRGYSFGGKAGVARPMLLADVLRDARRNGHDIEYIQTRAVGQLVPELYSELFKALPKKATDDYDVKEVSRIIRALHRLGVKYDGLRSSVRTRIKNKKLEMNREDMELVNRVLRTLWNNPYAEGENALRPTDY